jgi:hypothetical protein
VDAEAIARLHKRARRIRANAAVRRWEYRQRNHARGVWLRMRRRLADAASAWRISADDAALLIEEGIEPDPIGLALEPPMTILVVPQDRLETLASRRRLALGLGADLIGSRHMVLVPAASPA